jgi:hypothetical protein
MRECQRANMWTGSEAKVLVQQQSDDHRRNLHIHV